MSQAKTVAVIGAGVSGLTVAGALARQGFAVELFEARDRVGGCCSTTDVDGYRFNEGALYLVYHSCWIEPSKLWGCIDRRCCR